ncbi:MAG: helix-turn-helix transcriptional regulator [Anaerotignum sp.]|nr:helix-turn-helix transcriptional regulator [Anaerotignum sp.]
MKGLTTLKYRIRIEKLSQEELAHRLGVSRQSVSKWEQGLSFPETEKLIEISSLMNVSIDVLLKEEAQPEVEAKAGNHAVGRRWLIPVLIVLLIAAVVTIIAIAGRLDTLSNTLAEYAAEQETADMAKDDLPEKAETPPEENEVDETSEAGGLKIKQFWPRMGLVCRNPGLRINIFTICSDGFLVLHSSIVWTICRTLHRMRARRRIRESISTGPMRSIWITGATRWEL